MHLAILCRWLVCQKIPAISLLFGRRASGRPFCLYQQEHYFEETVFTSSGDARFIDTEDRLDMQISYSPKQLENLNLIFQAFNLTDAQYYAYQGTEQRAREYREAGRPTRPGYSMSFN